MVMSERDGERYSRQTLFDNIGKEGQERLLASKVVVIGAGALGGNIANMLARAGVGSIRVIDRDVVELNNLHRQLLFGELDVGKPKAEVVADKLAHANSSIDIESVVADVNKANIIPLIAGADIVLDGTDNVETRYLINDACVKHGISWIYGGAVKAEGMAMAIVPGITPCLRCLLPKVPEPGSTQNCNVVGIINTIPAVVAAIQVTEAVKIIVSRDYSKGLAVIDLWNSSFELVEIERNPECRTCSQNIYDFLEG